MENNNEKLIEELKKCIKDIEKTKTSKQDKIEKIPCVDLYKLTKKEKNHYEEIGSKLIKNNKYAVVTMAGGQRFKIRS